MPSALLSAPCRINLPLPKRVRAVDLAANNLKEYLAGAQIPTIARYDRGSPFCLPHKGRRTHKNKLKVRHDDARRLARIRHHDAKTFDEIVLTYHEEYVCGKNRPRPFAGKHYSRRAGEALVLPHSRGLVPEGTYEDIPYPCDIGGTCRWVVERPLQTMQRAVHIAWPDTTRWWLDEGTGEDTDGALWRTYVWRFHPDEYHAVWWQDVEEWTGEGKVEAAPKESVVFVVQPPWILGPQDLLNVATCTSFPPSSPDAPPLRAEERVWAKLYDTCKVTGCRAFVLTNYHGWLFGEFSADWTGVRTAGVKEFDACAPGVMQVLVLWVAAAMRLPGARFWRACVREAVEEHEQSAGEGDGSESEYDV